MRFADRSDAGRRMAKRLERFRRANAVVLGLPRGGVPVAFAVARALGAPPDVIVVRKLGLPSQPELAMGAIGEGGVRIVDRALVRRALVSDEELAAVEARERAELDRRARHLRGDRALPCRWRDARRSWWTTASPPAPPPARRARWRGRRARPTSCWPFLWDRRIRSPSWRPAMTSTRWCASRPTPCSWPSASSTPTSPRRPATRSSTS